MAKTRLRERQIDPSAVISHAEALARSLNTVLDGMTGLTVTSFTLETRVAVVSYGPGLLSSLVTPGKQVTFTALPGVIFTVEAVLTDASFRTVQAPASTISSGTCTFYQPPGATIVGVNQTPLTGLLSGQTTVQGCLEVLDARGTRWYNTSGLITRPKVFVGRFNTPAAANTLDISAAGFSSILSVQATAERNTTTLGDVPLANIRSYTTTQVIVQLVESTAILIGGQGLEFSANANNFVHLVVVGL